MFTNRDQFVREETFLSVCCATFQMKENSFGTQSHAMHDLAKRRAAQSRAKTQPLREKLHLNHRFHLIRLCNGFAHSHRASLIVGGKAYNASAKSCITCARWSKVLAKFFCAWLRALAKTGKSGAMRLYLVPKEDSKNG